MDAGSNLFVGRERELRELRSALDEAARGRGRLVLVSGGPGIGKTRLIEELAGEAGDRARVLWGRCWEGEGAPPFWPWVQALRSHVEECQPEDLARDLGAGAAVVAQLVPEIRERIPGLGAPPAPSDPEEARARLFDATVSFLRNGARSRPLVIVFDDLHWADRPSLVLVRFLARNLRDARILVVGAYRDVELRSVSGAEELLADLSREMVHAELRGLSPAEVKRLAESNAGGAVGEQVAAKLHAVTDGNPLFVGEMIRWLSVDAPKEWQRRLASRAPVPTAVRTAIRSHIASIGAPCREILRAASVIGREFDLPTLERAISDGGTTLSRLDEAIRAGLVARLPESVDRYRFSHALVRESLYDELGEVERARLHREVARTLEARHPHALPLADLAHHYFEAAALGEAAKAIELAKRSAAEAMRVLAYEEAARQLERALGLVTRTEAANEQERCELLLLLGEASFSFDLPRSREVFLEAAALAERLGDGPRLARAALGVAGPSVVPAFGPDFDAGFVDLLERALVALGEEESTIRAMVMVHIASATLFAPGAWVRARALAEEAVRIARQTGDPRTLLRVLVKGSLLLWRDSNGRARGPALTKEIAALGARCPGEVEAIFAGHGIAFVAEFEGARIREAYAELDRLLADSARSAFVRMATPAVHGIRAAAEGRFQDADRFAEEVLAVGQDMPSIAGQGSMIITMLPRFHQGRIAEMLTLFEMAEAMVPGVTTTRCALAWGLAELGEHGRAREILESVIHDRQIDVPPNFLWLASLSMLARVACLLGDARSGATLYEALTPCAEEIAMEGGIACFGPAAFYLGSLATLLSRFDEAESHFEKSLAKCAIIPSPPFAAHTQLQYAKMLRSRAGTGDAPKARELLAEALKTARALGMKPVEGEILALDASAEVTPAGVFRREGEFWTIGLDGTVFRLRDAKGFRYIATLLARPGTEVHAAELAGIDGETKLGDAGEMLDPRARDQYRRRLEDLRAEAEEAESFNDSHRAAKARAEIETISHELSAAFGLGGRARKAASDSERARLMVTQRIKAALKKIGEENDTLGRHLGNSIRTGNFCSYAPLEPIPWAL